MPYNTSPFPSSTHTHTSTKCADLPEVRSTMTFMATYSYLSTRSRRRCSVKLSILSMQAPSPRSLAWAKEMDLPRLTRISPGVDMDRKQQENSRSSHHALISNEIWSSICITKGCLKCSIFIVILAESFPFKEQCDTARNAWHYYFTFTSEAKMKAISFFKTSELFLKTRC
jgi:hypothetical protein